MKRIFPKEKTIAGQTASSGFSKETSQMLKGLLAAGIVLHHLQVATTVELPFGLVFASAGAPIVSVFFFISGYGLMHSFLLKREGYLRNYFSGRIWKILLPFMIGIAVFQILSFLDGNDIHVRRILTDLLAGDVDYLLPFSWYVFAILYFYIVFYLTFKWLTHRPISGLCWLLFFSAVCILTLRWLDFGYWWFVSTLAFNVGTVWRYMEGTILKILRTKYHLLAAFLLSLVVLHFGRRSMWHAPLYAGIVMIVLYGVRLPRSSALLYAGAVSYEIYLLHGIPIKFLRGNHIFIQSDVLYACAVLVTSVLFAAGLHCLLSCRVTARQ